MIEYTGDGSMPNLCAWADQVRMPPTPRDMLELAIVEHRLFPDPLPPLERRDLWRTPGQRERFVNNCAAVSLSTWQRMQADDESSMWRMTLGGDPDLYTDICAQRRRTCGQHTERPARLQRRRQSPR